MQGLARLVLFTPSLARNRNSAVAICGVGNSVRGKRHMSVTNAMLVTNDNGMALMAHEMKSTNMAQEMKSTKLKEIALSYMKLNTVRDNG